MPTRYKRKGSCSRGNWSENELISAVDAVKQGTMGVNQAARLYKIPCTTLRRRLCLGDTTKKNLGPPSLFGEQNELKLVRHITNLQNGGFALTRTIIREMAFKFAEHLGIGHKFNKTTEKAGMDWLQSFLSRNPGVTLARARGLNEEYIAEHFNILDGEQMWTSEDITSLISLVQIHSTIYDPSDPDYNNTEVVNTIWQQISIKLKRTAESCSKKWQELQSEYQKRSNNLKFNSNHKNKDWVYFDSLDFLKQYLQDSLCNESSSANNLNPFLYVSSNSQSSGVSQNVSTGDIFNESSSSASRDSVCIKTEIEEEDNFAEIKNHSGSEISNEMESDSKLNQDLDNTIDHDYGSNEMESYSNDLNLETNADGTNESMKLFLLSLLEDASYLSKPAQREFKLKTLALLHNLQ